jgi:hypothetical protein
VAGSSRTVLTAGHLLYDARKGSWRPSITWQVGHGDTRVVLRSIRSFAGYADAVYWHGENSAAAFAKDAAVLIGYEELSDGSFAIPHPAAMANLRGHAEKVVVGFPAGLYGMGDPLRDTMHRTGPFTTPFSVARDSYMVAAGVASGPGASGGGVWVRVGGSWELSGWLVSGLSEALGGGSNSVGVVALSSPFTALIAEAVEIAELVGVPEITAQPDALVEVGWTESGTVQVEVFSIPDFWIEWKYVDAREPEAEPRLVREVGAAHRPVRTDSEDASSLQIPPRSTFWNNKLIFAEVSNELGVVRTERALFRYVDAEALQFTAQPQSLVLEGNASAHFAASVTGFPQPIFTWEVRFPNSAEFVALSDLPLAVEGHDQAAVVIEPKGGYLSGTEIRLVADNGFDRLYSETVTLVYADLGELNIRQVSGPGADEIIRRGQTVTLEIENTTTLEAEVYWWFTDPYGNSPGFRPSGWRMSEDSSWAITNHNTGEAFHGYTVNSFISGHYYVQGSHGPVRRALSAEGPSWTLRAEGPAHLQPDLRSEIDQASRRLTLIPTWSALTPPLLEWQASVDGGLTWYPLGTSIGQPLTLDGHDLLARGALYRAKIDGESEGIVLTNPLVVGSQGAMRIERSRGEVTEAENRGNVVALFEDSVVARQVFSPTGTGEQVQVFTRGPTGWHQDEGPFGTTLFEHQVQALQFLDSRRLLIASDTYSAEGHSRCGAVLLYGRSEEGSWHHQQTLFSPQPASDGFFGSGVHYENGTLVVSERRGWGAPSRVHIFEESAGGFSWKQTLDFSGFDYPNQIKGWHVAIRGDRLIFSSTHRIFVFDRTADDRWIPVQEISPSYVESPAFLTNAGGLLLYQGGFYFDSTAIIDWLKPGTDHRLASSSTFLCGIGGAVRQDSKTLIAQNRAWNAVRVEYTLVLFGVAANGQSLAMSGVTVEGPYVLEAFDLSDSSLLLVVRDSRLDWTTAPRELWITPLDGLVPADGPLLHLPVQARAVSEGATATGRLAVQTREIQEPHLPVDVHYSLDLKTWRALPLDKFERRVVSSDADGDGKTALIEFLLPAAVAGTPEVFYRLVERSGDEVR